METKWLSRKQVAVRVVEQWGSLTEYFLKCFPKQKDAFREISKTARYQRIAEALEDTITLADVSFCAFIARDFEMILLPYNQTGLRYIFYIQKCNHYYEIWLWNLYVPSTWLRIELLSDCKLLKWTTRKNIIIYRANCLLVTLSLSMPSTSIP